MHLSAIMLSWLALAVPAHHGYGSCGIQVSDASIGTAQLAVTSCGPSYYTGIPRTPKGPWWVCEKRHGRWVTVRAR